MNLTEFKASLSGDKPPAGLNAALQAMWQEKKGSWDAAHDLLQGQGNRDTDWVHAYLHRVEGDQANANYWYSRAGRTMPSESLEVEWDDIVGELLS